MSEATDEYYEPSSGTDLEDEALRDIDNQDLNADDNVSVDEAAEQEARENPLNAAQRHAAERELENRDLGLQGFGLPPQIRNQMQRRYDMENVAAGLQAVQFDSASEHPHSQQLQLSETLNTSLGSEIQRRFMAEAYKLPVQKPVNDQTFRLILQDLEGNPNVRELREKAVIKMLYFLKTYQLAQTEFRQPLYIMRAQDLFGRANKSSLVIDLSDIQAFNADMADFLVKNPRVGLAIMNEAVHRFVLSIEANIEVVHARIEARIRVDKDVNQPIQCMSLKNLSITQLERLVAVKGVVLSRSEKKPRLVKAMFQCTRCNALTEYYDIRSANIVQERQEMNNKEVIATIIPRKCANEACTSRTLVVYQPLSIYQDTQKLVLQERQEDIEPGFMPEKKDIIISGDLINSINPGDTVQVTGIFKMVIAQAPVQPFPTYQTIIDANHVSTLQDVSVNLTSQDIKDLQLFTQVLTGEDLDKTVFAAIAPSIHGHEMVKQSIAMSLVGGVQHTVADDQPKTRGDLHVLLLGDPGIAKSQILRYVQQCAPKSHITTGKGASAAGLTVAVKRSATGEYALHAGSLVLANDGVCLIDELDKMEEQDRVALHQAMEQQEVSIAKAGIIATLPARCAVIAAANPVNQQYNANLPLNYNLNVGEALISRFDLIIVVRDIIDKASDERLARFIIDSHARNHEQARQALGKLQIQKDALADLQAQLQQATDDQKEDLIQAIAAMTQVIIDLEEQNAKLVTAATRFAIPENYTVSQVVGWIQQNPRVSFVLPQTFLKKFFSYAKTCTPNISQETIEAVKRFYTTLRQKVQEINGVQVTQRAIGTLIRLTEAHAKMHLRVECTPADIQFAIELYSKLFIQQQKQNIMRRVERDLRKFRAAGSEDFGGMMAVLDDCFIKLQTVLRNGAHLGNSVSITYLRNECAKAGIDVADGFFDNEEFNAAYVAQRGVSGAVEQVYKK